MLVFFIGQIMQYTKQLKFDEFKRNITMKKIIVTINLENKIQFRLLKNNETYLS